MIVCDQISKRIGNFSLKKISLEIPEGYLYGLVGRNGSGKTSLFHILLGLYRPDQGSLFIDGHTYEEEEKEIHNQIGVVLAEELMAPELSLLSNGESYGPYYSGYDSSYYRQLLQEFGLEEKKRYGKLSKGQKLKAEFAFSLACHPKYLFLDEPTANFDPEFRKAFFQKIQEFISDGKHTVLLATHLTEDLDRLADGIIDLDKGQVVFAGDLESFRDTYRIVSGEKWQLNLLKKEDLLAMEERAYGCKALIRYHKLHKYREDLTLTVPSIEEFMYFYDLTIKQGN